MPTRRTVLATSLAAVATLGWAGPLLARPAPLKILVLGGTGFLGPHFVETARTAGHTLTLFNRGKRNPALFQDIEQIHGDRKLDLSGLAGRQWDAVLDTSGYVPADVAATARLLAPNVRQYIFVSTISVYASMDTPGMDESAPLATLADPSVQEVTGETYGGLKALCEQAARDAYGDAATIIRSGLIVGPGDPTDRFTYWPARALRGGEALAPGTPDDPTQFIDVRDLAAFLLHTIEQRIGGTFNVDAAAGALTMGQVLDACALAARAVMPQRQCARAPCPQPESAHWTYVPADFLAAQKVAPWSDMPIWIPARGSEAGFGRISSVKAQAAGLRRRPLQDTVVDTLAWWKQASGGNGAALKAGIDAQRETAVLAAWHERTAADSPA